MQLHLTSEQAYDAAFRFLDAYFGRSPSDDLGALLGAMALASDGKPMDAAFASDWALAVNSALSPTDQATNVIVSLPFANLPLHDAVIGEVGVRWGSAEVAFSLSLVDGALAELVFTGVTNVVIPRVEPWGPSSSINTLRQPGPRSFEVEVQSGDIVTIEANTFAFVAAATPNPKGLASSQWLVL